MGRTLIFLVLGLGACAPESTVSDTGSESPVSTIDTADPATDISDPSTLVEHSPGAVSLCSSLVLTEETNRVQATGTVLATGLMGDADAPGDCLTATRYLSFSDADGETQHLGWAVTDTDGSDISPELAVAKGDTLSLDYSQEVDGYSFWKGVGAFDADGELLMALSTGDVLPAEAIAPLVVSQASEAYDTQGFWCGVANVHRIDFAGASDSVSLEIGEAQSLTVGATKLVAHALESSHIVCDDSIAVSDMAMARLDWGVWRP